MLSTIGAGGVGEDLTLEVMGNGRVEWRTAMRSVAIVLVGLGCTLAPVDVVTQSLTFPLDDVSRHWCACPIRTKRRAGRAVALMVARADPEANREVVRHPEFVSIWHPAASPPWDSRRISMMQPPREIDELVNIRLFDRDHLSTA